MRCKPSAHILRAAVATAVVAASLRDAPADAVSDRWIRWHRDRAAALLAEGRIEEHVEELRAVAVLAPADRDAPTLAAIGLAEVLCAPPNEPSESDPMYRTVEALIGEGVARGGTHDPGLAYAIGRLAFATRDFRKAQQMLGIASRRGFDPVRARLWHYRAVVSDTARLLRDAVYDVAIRRLETVMKESPGHPDELAARLNLASVYRKRQDSVVAEKMLRDLVDENPWMARAHLALGQVYLELSRNDDAAASIRTAIDVAQERDDGGLFTGRPVMLDALIWLATLEIRRSDFDAAQRALDQYAALQKDSPDEQFLRGTILLRRGGGRDQIAEAARCLRRATRMDKDRREFRLRLIEALNELGETEELALEQKTLEVLDAARAAETKARTEADLR